MPDLALFRSSLQDLLRPKRLLVSGLLAVLPALIALLWQLHPRSFDRDIAYHALAGDLILGFLLIILAVIAGTGVVTQETEQKTIAYLLTRPLPRWRILMAKFAAAFAVTTLTVWLSVILLAFACFGTEGLGASGLGRDLAVLPVGVLAYGGLFLFLAVLLKRPLLAGILFAFGWESWVPNLSGQFQKTSPLAYLRTLANHPKPETPTMKLGIFFSSGSPESIPAELAWKVMAGMIMITLALAIYLFTTREFVPREDTD